MADTVGLDVTERLEEGNGHQEESQEQLEGVLKKLSSLHRGDGSVVSMSKQELGLLQTILRSSTEKYREEIFWRMVDFIDQDEALDHVAAFYEAKELGMDTTFNVSFVFALCSVNRKGVRNNLSAMIMDTIQFGQHARNGYNQKGRDASKNRRSPIA